MTPSFFISNSYLYNCRLFFSSNFKNFKCDFPQLKRPKVAQANDNIWCPKATKSNNVTMSVFYTFPFSSNFLLSILQNTIINKFFDLDFTSTLKIGQSQLPILLVKHGHVWISNLSMFLLPCHISFCIYSNFCPPY